MSIRRQTVARLVHLETGMVANEYPIPSNMTDSEIEQWCRMLQKMAGDGYDIEWNEAA